MCIRRIIATITLTTTFANAILSHQSALAIELSPTSTLEEVTPEVFENALTVNNGLEKPDKSSFKSSEITIPVAPTQPIELSHPKKDETWEIIVEDLDAHTDISIGNRGELFYEGIDETTTTVLPKVDGSLQLITTIPDSASPTNFSYTVRGDNISSHEKTPDGAIFFLDKSGNAVGGLAAPWAFDAEGTPVPTWFEVTGETVTQVVDHLNGSFTYPIVSDPYLGMQLYEWASVSFLNQRPGAYAINAKPTLWGYAVVSPATFNHHIYEVTQKLPIIERWRMTPTIIEQHKCHIALGPLERLAGGNGQYNMESFRPIKPWNQQMRDKCNP